MKFKGSGSKGTRVIERKREGGDITIFSSNKTHIVGSRT